MRERLESRPHDDGNGVNNESHPNVGTRRNCPLDRWQDLSWICRRWHGGLNSSFIVRKISSGEGVERTFQLYAPTIASIEVKRRGDVRRAKLYYLRNRSGKAARIKEKLSK